MRKKNRKRKCDAFFAKMVKSGLALSYGDVKLKTCYSKVLPNQTDLRTRFSKNIFMNIPIVSSPMDTITESEMAIALAMQGGLGIIHKGLDPKEQAADVGKVKRHMSAFVPDPVCVKADQTVSEVLKKGYKFLSFPVMDNSGNVIGIVTRSYFDFCLNETMKIRDIMRPDVISAPEGTDVKRAYEIMMANRIKILPVFSKQNKFLGIYTFSDVKRIVKGHSRDFNLAKDGTLRVGAAIGVAEDARQRMELLAKAKVDVVVIDTAHGDSRAVVETLKYCKRQYPHIDVVAGNVSEPESAKRLARAGADGIRVGQGPGSICTTRIVAGVGCPQFTAVYNCSKAGVPVCADGGIEYSGDITLALAAGASTVMLGRLLAGTKETPGEVIYRHDTKPVKVYRGMGSMAAMKENKSSRMRYGQVDTPDEKIVPEGVESEVDYQGEVSVVVARLIGGLRAGMGYCNAKTITILQKKADFHKIEIAGIKESHPHGLERIKKAPNYNV